MWRVLQNCLLYVFLLCTVAPALAGGVLRLDPQAAGQRAAHQIDLLEDPSRILGLSDVQGPEYAERFLPASLVEGDINLGYSKSAYWLRLTVQAPQDHIIRNWLLELGFPALDHISAYIVDKHGWRAYQTGDMLTFDQRPYPHRHFIFPMLLDPGQITTIYLRVESQGTLTLPVMIWTEPALLVYSQSAYGLLALYYGMLLALALYNLLLFLSLRDPVYLAYVLFTVSMAIGQISLNGLGNQYLWPDWPAWGNVALPVGFALCGAFGAWFTRLFLHTRQTAPLYDRVLFGLGGIFVELFKDVVFRLAPVDRDEAHRMVSEIKGYKMFTGFRGRPKSDVEILEKSIIRLSEMVMDHPEIIELDINPLLVHEEGKGATVADCRIILKPLGE